MRVDLTDQSVLPFTAVHDDKAATVVLEGMRELTGKRATLSCSRAGDDLTIKGTFLEREVEVLLKLRDPSKMLLVTRGFHWINEYPFNR
jgi:hypothetical protein